MTGKNVHEMQPTCKAVAKSCVGPGYSNTTDLQTQYYRKLGAWSARNDITVSRIPYRLPRPTDVTANLPEDAETHQTAHHKKRNRLLTRARGWVSRRQPKPDSIEYHRYCSTSLLRVFQGLEEGETEHRIESLENWSEAWKWRFMSQHKIDDPHCTILVLILMKDLAQQLRRGLSWGSDERHPREIFVPDCPNRPKEWQHKLYWNDGQEVPMWQARIQITGRNPEDLLKMEFRKFINPETITKYVALDSIPPELLTYLTCTACGYSNGPVFVPIKR